MHLLFHIPSSRTALSVGFVDASAMADSTRIPTYELECRKRPSLRSGSATGISSYSN